MTLDGVVQPLHVVALINDSDSENIVMTPEEVMKITDLAMQLGHIGRAHRRWLGGQNVWHWQRSTSTLLS